MIDANAEVHRAILIAADVLGTIRNDVRKYGGGHERGGILLGLRRGAHLEIRQATCPMGWDRATRNTFSRSSRGHQEIARKSWQQSGMQMDWVGEWHSHPEQHPTPSSIDLTNWAEILRLSAQPMAFLIVGYEGIWLGLAHQGNPPVPYRLVEQTDSFATYIN